ncbi:hypothetical protein ACTXT7_014319 [Hymenolepis weldensis]
MHPLLFFRLCHHQSLGSNYPGPTVVFEVVDPTATSSLLQVNIVCPQVLIVGINQLSGPYMSVAKTHLPPAISRPIPSVHAIPLSYSRPVSLELHRTCVLTRLLAQVTHTRTRTQIYACHTPTSTLPPTFLNSLLPT